MMENGFRLVVIGGTSGIGRAVVTQALKRGWRVVTVGRTLDHVEATQHSLCEEVDQGQIRVLQADMATSQGVNTLRDALQEVFNDGVVDGLVNGAGLIGNGGIELETLETFETVIKSNLWSLFNSVKLLLPYLKASVSNPSIVNVSSVCGARPCNSLSYSAAKAAVDHMTRTLAKELAKYGIRVNCVNPSVVESNLQLSSGLFKNTDEYEAWLESMTPNHPLGRIGRPEEIAGSIEYLLSPAAAWITGANLAIDGGRGIA